MRRLGRPPERNRTYKDRPGAYGIIWRGDYLLLSREPERDLVLPGGGIDPGESPLQGLYREVLEETGWSISVKRKLGVYAQYRYMPNYDKYARKVCTIYECRAGQRLSAPLEEGHEPIWMTPEEAVDALADECDGNFLYTYLGGAFDRSKCH